MMGHHWGGNRKGGGCASVCARADLYRQGTCLRERAGTWGCSLARGTEASTRESEFLLHALGMITFLIMHTI